MQILKIIPDTVVDGPGLRTSIYFAGCKVHCEGCHNPESWDLNGGEEVFPNEVIDKIKEYRNKGVTLTGGNPLDQKHLFHVRVLCEELKREGYNIWLYSGYTWEQIITHIQNADLKNGHTVELVKILGSIDVIVDGPFILKLRDTTLLYRGSSNQRIIDVKKSLTFNETILYEPH